MSEVINSQRLSSLKTNDSAKIISINVDDYHKNKFISLGFVEGTAVKITKNGDQNLVLNIKGTEVVISKTDAHKIFVETISAGDNSDNCCNKCESCKKTPRSFCSKNVPNNVKFCPEYANINICNKKIILVGNPNVGKSKIFSRITGIKVSSSNFPGTTIESKSGKSDFFGIVNKKNYKISTEILDIPGLYSMSNNTGEKNAGKIAEQLLLDTTKYDLIIYVLDSEFLERSLQLGLSILALNKPVLFVLNKYENAKSNGIFINPQSLETELANPVVAIEAISGSGFNNLENAIVEIFVKIENNTINVINKFSVDEKANWAQISNIINKVQVLEHRHPTFLEKFSKHCVRPRTGIFIASLVLIVALISILVTGESLISGFEWIFSKISDLFASLVTTETWNSYVKTFLFGLHENIDGETIAKIPGVLNDGLLITISVFIYYFIFYLIFELLADVGYLPRLATLMDSILHKLGIHGYGIIPLLLGFGCKVPAVLSTRILDKKRERFIALILILLIFPCISCFSGIIYMAKKVNTIDAESGQYDISSTVLVCFAIFATILLIGIISAFLLNKFKKGDSSEIFMELPPLRTPKMGELIHKMSIRLKEFFVDTAAYIVVGVIVLNILCQTNILDYISENQYVRSFMENFLGLPPENAFNVIFGFLRKDAAIALLQIQNNSQLIVASVFMTLYLPCTSTIFVIKREFSWKETFSAFTLTFLISFFVAMILFQILS
jgi:ferrous iron transport protein B